MTLPETSTPILAAVFVGGIGLLGIVAGVVACRRVFAEGQTLDKGEDALTASLPSVDLNSTDPITWLASNALPKNSHFGDHLLTVWRGWLGERVPTLSELHNLSARRERRRLSARISGGITALLLICGIAGTLLCIHPILQAFTIPITDKGEVLIEPLVAQKLIRSLGSAFLPSLTALVATVAVAILRGIYLQSTTGLAWRLDRFAVDQLFPLFKPKRFGAELTEVHLKLSRLVDRLEERDREFGVGFEIFGKAALDLKESGPRLKAASDRITNAADRLASEAESMTKALNTHLGENSTLANGTRSISEILGTCLDAANQLREGGVTLATSLAEAAGTFATARNQLGAAVGEIPTRIQQGCDMGSKSLIDAARNFDQAHTRLTTTVAGIPDQIQQGCDLGSRTLVEANQRTTQDAAASIAKAAEAATLGINSAVTNVQQNIETGCANAGEVLVRASRDAASQAAMTLGQSALAAANGIKAEVGPLTQVAAEMRTQLDATKSSIDKAGADFKSTAREASNQAATAFGEAGAAAARSINAEVEPITQVAEELSKALEKVKLPAAPPSGKLWKRILSLGMLK
jgi:hypothetical protein